MSEQPGIRIAAASRSGVGESPVWSVVEARLYWVDITGRALRRLDPATGAEEAWALPEIATSVGLRRDGGLVVGLRKRVCLYEPGGALVTLAEIEPDLPRNRLNEGAVAPDGSYWVGTMRDNIAEDGGAREIDAWTGALWRVAPDGTVTRLGPEGLGIANLMAWRAGRFVTADTLADRLFAHDHGPEGLSNRRVLLEGGAPGLPDGGAFDEEGELWTARVGGGCLLRLDREGAPAGTVALPCANPTSCAFGGPDLATLFVTSSTFGMSAAEIEAAPEHGAVLALDPDLGRRGVAPALFG